MNHYFIDFLFLINIFFFLNPVQNIFLAVSVVDLTWDTNAMREFYLNIKREIK